MTRPAQTPWRVGLLALWLVTLFWPFTHTGGFRNPVALSAFPLALAIAEFLPSWPLTLLAQISAAAVEIVLQQPHVTVWWQSLAVLTTALSRFWEQMPPNLTALPPPVGIVMVLGAVVLGWLVFRQAYSRSRILLLLIIGPLILTVNHTFWHLEAEIPMVAYLLLGLGLLADSHLSEVAPRRIGRPRWSWYLLTTGLIAAPLILGWLVSPQSPRQVSPIAIDSSSLFSQTTPSAAGGTGFTGLGIGDTDINHAVKPSFAPVMTVAGAPNPSYWQAAIYTTFNGVSWSAPSGPIYPFQVGQFVHPFFSPATSQFPVVAWHVSFTLINPTTAILPYTGTPIQITEASSPAAGRVLSSRDELVGPHYRYYTLETDVPTLNMNALASAPFLSPPSSLLSDLEVPANLSPKIGHLARRATQGASGPWEVGQDLVAFLRRHEHYSFNFTPAQGPNANAVNQFLLVSHVGYCDQFSTSFVMMARTLGIPARWVVGYGPGSYQKASHRYLIRAVDAHSWAELYIAPYGWIPIDPTPGWALPSESPLGRHIVESTTPTRRESLPPLNPVTPPPHPSPWRTYALNLATTLSRLGLTLGEVAVALGLAFLLWRRFSTRPALRLRRIAQGFSQIVFLSAKNARQRTMTLREQLQWIPLAYRHDMEPVVQLLEQSWYGGRLPSATTLIAVERRLTQTLRKAWWKKIWPRAENHHRQKAGSL